MAQNSLLNCPLHYQLRELYGRLVYTHKAQEKEADIARIKLFRWQNIQLVVSSLTATGVLTSIWGDCVAIKVISAILSAVLFVISAYLKNSDFGGLSRKHSEAAAYLWDMREKYLSLLVDLQQGSVTQEDVCRRRDCLQDRLAIFFKDAPRTTSEAYKDAVKALKENEEFTFSDKEIDCFLPESMRMSVIKEKESVVC